MCACANVCMCMFVYTGAYVPVSVYLCVSQCVFMSTHACQCVHVFCYSISSMNIKFQTFFFPFDSYVICPLQHIHSLLFHVFMKDISQIQYAFFLCGVNVPTQRHLNTKQRNEEKHC